MRRIPVELRMYERVPIAMVFCPLCDIVRSSECCRECVYFDGVIYGSSIICLWRPYDERTVKS